ncbi:MAG: NapC/NirT family cytochrome c [Candidatus Abyssubacteria bacterium]
MTSTPQPEKLQKPLLQNRISIAGLLIAGASLFLILFFLVIDFIGGGRSIYTGIVAYMVLPVFLVGGIAIIIAGVLLERHRRHLEHPEHLPLFPVLDLNDPNKRRTLLWVVSAIALFLLLSAVGSYRAYHFSDSVAFCGETCHQVMKPEFTAYRNSPHARVACVDCHIGPGAGWFVRSKLSGMYQVYATAFDLYPRPIPTPIKNLRPSKETCEQCHWPKQFYGAVQQENFHFLPDEQNTPWHITMLIKVGGGDPTFGRVGGIHWHMSIENQIEYIATDKQRQEIAWIRKTDENGTVTIYESTENPLPNPPESYETRLMDCIDCHDRPTHIFKSPSRAVNLALQTRRIDPGLPYIKAKGVELLAKEYTTTNEALRTIADELQAYYKTEYPEVYELKQLQIKQAVDELENIYKNNFFPEMNVRWDTYPDNIGHLIWRGCYRCHDGNHVSAGGQMISRECDSCHSIISQGTGEETATSLAGLEFKHPVDIGEAWREMPCYECHTGASP